MVGLRRRAKKVLSSIVRKFTLGCIGSKDPWEEFDGVHREPSIRFSFTRTPPQAYVQHSTLTGSPNNEYVLHYNPSQDLLWSEPVERPQYGTFRQNTQFAFAGANCETGSSEARVSSSSWITEECTSSVYSSHSEVEAFPQMPQRVRRMAARQNLRERARAPGSNSRPTGATGENYHPINDFRVADAVESSSSPSPSRDNEAQAHNEVANPANGPEISRTRRRQFTVTSNFVISDSELPDPFATAPTSTRSAHLRSSPPREAPTPQLSPTTSILTVNSELDLLSPNGSAHTITTLEALALESAHSTSSGYQADNSISPSTHPSSLRRHETHHIETRGYISHASHETFQSIDHTVAQVEGAVDTLINDLESQANELRETRQLLEQRTEELRVAREMIRERDEIIERLNGRALFVPDAADEVQPVVRFPSDDHTPVVNFLTVNHAPVEDSASDDHAPVVRFPSQQDVPVFIFPSDLNARNPND